MICVVGLFLTPRKELRFAVTVKLLNLFNFKILISSTILLKRKGKTFCELFNSYKQIWCAQFLGELHDGYEVQCCGGEVVSDRLKCCGNVTMGQAFVENTDNICCGSKYVSVETSVCCTDELGRSQVQ